MDYEYTGRPVENDVTALPVLLPNSISVPPYPYTGHLQKVLRGRSPFDGSIGNQQSVGFIPAGPLLNRA